MQGQTILSIGIAFVGATLGYMVGGSASPVVSVAVPTIFGLIVTAIGLMQATQPSKELFEVLKTYGETANSFPEIVEYRGRVQSAPRRIGLSLIVFSVFYLAAATFGAKVRIEHLLAPTVAAPAFPWSKSQSKPPTIAVALDWIALQGRLRELGYDDVRISLLYDLQVQDWKSRPTAVVGSSAVTPKEDPLSSSQSSVTDDLAKEWLKTIKESPGNPFANQPTKELLDKLKNLKQPGSDALPGQMPG